MCDLLHFWDWRLFIGVLCIRFRAEGAPTFSVQPLTIKLVSGSGCETLNDMDPKARGWKIDLEYLKKRGSGHVNLVEDLGKRPKTYEHHSRGQ